MKKEILITGAAGFIGSHLSKSLINKNYKIYGIDNFSDFYSRTVKEANIRELRNNKNFTLVEADLALDKTYKNIPVAPAVVHLAAQPGVRDSWGKNFKYYIKDNITALQKLLEFCKDNKVEKFIFASSSSVYGETKILPMNEIKSVPVPFSPYGSTKLMGEHLCRIYNRNFSLNTVVLRFFSVYGPGQRPDMAFSKLFKGILTGSEFYLYGDGEQTRDFTYIDDIISGIVKAVETPGLSGKIFNLGGGNKITMNKIIKLAEKITGKKVIVKYSGNKKGDVRDTLSDISIAQKVLKYKPLFSFEKGLKNQFIWYRKNLNILSK